MADHHRQAWIRALYEVHFDNYSRLNSEDKEKWSAPQPPRMDDEFRFTEAVLEKDSHKKDPASQKAYEVYLKEKDRPTTKGATGYAADSGKDDGESPPITVGANQPHGKHARGRPRILRDLTIAAAAGLGGLGIGARNADKINNATDKVASTANDAIGHIVSTAGRTSDKSKNAPAPMENYPFDPKLRYNDINPANAYSIKSNAETVVKEAEKSQFPEVLLLSKKLHAMLKDLPPIFIGNLGDYTQRQKEAAFDELAAQCEKLGEKLEFLFVHIKADGEPTYVPYGKKHKNEAEAVEVLANVQKQIQGISPTRRELKLTDGTPKIPSEVNNPTADSARVLSANTYAERLSSENPGTSTGMVH